MGDYAVVCTINPVAIGATIVEDHAPTLNGICLENGKRYTEFTRMRGRLDGTKQKLQRERFPVTPEKVAELLALADRKYLDPNAGVDNDSVYQTGYLSLAFTDWPGKEENAPFPDTVRKDAPSKGSGKAKAH